MTESIGFQYPQALLLLPLIPLLFRLRKRCRRPIRYSAADLIGLSARPGRLKRHGADAMGVLFMVMAVLSAANLRYSVRIDRHYLESRWIMMVQDLSGSMNRQSREAPGKTLGDLSLEGVETFIGMRRPDDLIGMIAFSSHAKLIAPPTFDRHLLLKRISLLHREGDSAVFRELTAGGATNAAYATWLALCTFFMLLPDEHQPTYEALQSLRFSLTGETTSRFDLPEALWAAPARGMAIVLFTDGRIGAGDGPEEIQKGLPNFINVIGLLRRLGIRFYIIVVGKEIESGVRKAMMPAPGEPRFGGIFHMPRRFDRETIAAAYGAIHRLERNRLLYETVREQKETRRATALAGVFCLILYGGLICSKRFGRI